MVVVWLLQDPLGFGKDPAKRERYALSELKNGRAAMIAVCVIRPTLRFT